MKFHKKQQIKDKQIIIKAKREWFTYFSIDTVKNIGKYILRIPPIISAFIVLFILLGLFYHWGGARLNNITVTSENALKIVENWTQAELGFKQLVMYLICLDFFVMIWGIRQKKPQGNIRGY